MGYTNILGDGGLIAIADANFNDRVYYRIGVQLDRFKLLENGSRLKRGGLAVWTGNSTETKPLLFME